MQESEFDGRLLQKVGWEITAIVVSIFTLGICLPWGVCMLEEWEIKHTIINGRRLEFNGRAIELFGNWIKWFFLIIITLGIYCFWVDIEMKKWVVKHTHFVEQDLK